MLYRWDIDKNARLKAERGISFEEILGCIAGKRILDIIEHPNKHKYPRQKVLVIEFNGYAYHVPFVEEKEGRFLKTIIPSRQSTRKYLEEYYET